MPYRDLERRIRIWKQFLETIRRTQLTYTMSRVRRFSSKSKTGMIIRASRNSVVDRKVTIDGNEFEVRKVRFGETCLVNTLDNNAEVPHLIAQEGVVMVVSAIAGSALKEAGRTDFARGRNR